LSASRTGRFTPRKRAPGTHWIGGWVGPRAVVEAVVKRKFPAPAENRNLEPESSSPYPRTIPTELSRLTTKYIQAIYSNPTNYITTIRNLLRQSASGYKYWTIQRTQQNRTNEVMQCVQKEASYIKSNKKRFNRHSSPSNRSSTKFPSRIKTARVEII
jgi:hypothetical protein